MPNTCDVNNPGPAFEIAPPNGTDPCVQSLNTSGGPPAPCNSMLACCNFFSLIKEGNSTTFIFSAGGPFELPVPGPSTTYVCPPQFTPTFLTAPTTPATFAQPGPLSAEICVPGLPVGTYQAFARMEVRAFTPGTHVQVLFRPNCTDASVEYVVLDYYSPCPPVTTIDVAPDVFLPTDQRTLDANLIVPVTTCNPGFSLLVHTGQQQCAFDTGLTPNIRNFQFELLRLTARDLNSCEGSPLQNNVGTDDIATPSGCIAGP